MAEYAFILLLNACWQVAAIYVAGVSATRILRRTTARLECLMWIGVTVAASVTPWLSLLAFRNSSAAPHHWAWSSESASNLGLWINGSTSGSGGVSAPLHDLRLMSEVISWIYVCFVAVQVLRLMYGWIQVRRTVASATVCDDMRTMALLSKLWPHTGQRRPELRISHDVATPFAIGFLKPIIVIPQFLIDDPDKDLLSLALGHELAHVRRQDWILNLALLLLSIPFSFHPCIALMRRKVEASREAACDELAAGCVASPSVYARALLDLAGRLAQPQPSLAAAYKGAALGVLDGSTLGDRVRRLMDRSPRLSTKQTRMLFCTALCMLLIACVAVTNFALASPSSSSSGSVAGVWTGKLTDRNPRVEGVTVVHNQAYLQLEQKGAQITGVIGADAEHNAPIEDAVLQGNRLHFLTTMKHGDEATHWTVDLVVDGDQMSGAGHALRSDQHSWDVEINLTKQK